MAPALPQAADSPRGSVGRSEGRFQGGDEVADSGQQVGGAAVLLDQSHDGRTHDDAVGHSTYFHGLCGGGDPETHADRPGGDGAQRAQLLGQFGRHGHPLAGDPGQRNHVDEALARASDAAHALGRRRGRHQVDEVEPGRLDPRLKLAPCARIDPYLPPGFKAWGATRVGLRCTDGAVRWNVYLPIIVKVFGPALVAASALPAGTVLGETDLQVAEVDLAAHMQPAITDLAAAVGRPLALALNPGDTLRQHQLRARQWFNAGETVKLVASGRGFAVHGEGLALAPGLEGRAVRVRTDSGRVVTGMPAGERRVEIAL